MEFASADYSHDVGLGGDALEWIASDEHYVGRGTRPQAA
jgi:hypothetical protein